MDFIIEFFKCYTQGFPSFVCHAHTTPPGLVTIRHLVLSYFGYYKTLGTIRHWVLSDIGYVQTLGMVRLWVFSH